MLFLGLIYTLFSNSETKGAWHLSWHLSYDVIDGYSDTPYVIKYSMIDIYVRNSKNIDARRAVMENLYRTELQRELRSMVEKWESIFDVKLNEFKIKKMSTKWGSCNQKDKRVWFSLELAKKPLECIEYVVAHELIDLIERNHNNKFFRLLDRHFPRCVKYKDELNELPLGQR